MVITNDNIVYDSYYETVLINTNGIYYKFKQEQYRVIKQF